MTAILKTELSLKKVLSITFDYSFVKKLELKGNYNHLSVNMFYQKIVVNTESDYFYNDTHYKKVWDQKSFYLELESTRGYLVKVQKSSIKRDMKNFIFQNKDEHTTYTLEMIEQDYDLINKENMEDITCLSLLVQSDNYESIYEIK